MPRSRSSDCNLPLSHALPCWGGAHLCCGAVRVRRLRVDQQDRGGHVALLISHVLFVSVL